jgi:hypothetical protein
MGTKQIPDIFHCFVTPAAASQRLFFYPPIRSRPFIKKSYHLDFIYIFLESQKVMKFWQP